MASNFRLKLAKSNGYLFSYEAIVDGSKEWLIALDEAKGIIYPTRIDGNAVGEISMNMTTGDVVGSLEHDWEVADFKTMAHLSYQFKKSGTPPTEIHKYFA